MGRRDKFAQNGIQNVLIQINICSIIILIAHHIRAALTLSPCGRHVFVFFVNVAQSCRQTNTGATVGVTITSIQLRLDSSTFLITQILINVFPARTIMNQNQTIK
jgi:hypothetical protein